MARQIDYYFSLQSPWAYIGNKAFHDLAAQHALVVNYKPVTLGELFAETGGLPLAKRHPARQRYRMMELQRWREKRGLPFHLKPKHWPFNSRLVDGVAVAAIAAGKNPAVFMSKVFPAIWEEQLDLGDPAVVTKLANESGLPGEALVAQSPSGCDQCRRVRLSGLGARWRSVLGPGPDRFTRRRVEIGP